jgi:hypothetical protein
VKTLRQMSEVRCQRFATANPSFGGSEVRSQTSDIRGQTSDVSKAEANVQPAFAMLRRGRHSMKKADVRDQMSDVSKAEANVQRPMEGGRAKLRSFKL